MSQNYISRPCVSAASWREWQGSARKIDSCQLPTVQCTGRTPAQGCFFSRKILAKACQVSNEMNATLDL
jgi:hypothetical protein